MKTVWTTLLSIVLFALIGGAQDGEFTTFSNGLIYSPESMAKLEQIVDSLNLEFKQCDASPEFNGPYQTVGHKVSVKGLRAKAAQKDLEKPISFEAFLVKYPNAEVDHQVVIVRDQYTSYQGKKVVQFQDLGLGGNYPTEIEETMEQEAFKPRKGTWIDEFYSYGGKELVAFYFPSEFESTPLPEKYALKVGYADCLIDTTSTKIKKDAEYGWISLPDNWQKLSQKKQIKLLDQMRNTRVVGGCSQDDSPRIHAVNIALVSAETQQWEVFLKAHLDIMNDRFERVSDGSYAWGARETYIRELEELNINVSDLILGTVFRISNPAKNHYFGRIPRLSRALTESQDLEAIKEQILAIVADDELDDYNRMVFFYLFQNMNYYIQDEAQKTANVAALETALGKMPKYIQLTYQKE